jgi:hypothetical protein
MKWGALDRFARKGVGHWLCGLILLGCSKPGSAPLNQPGSAGAGDNVATAIAEADARAAAPGTALEPKAPGNSAAPSASCPCPVTGREQADTATAPEPPAGESTTTPGAAPSPERAPASAKNHRAKVKELFELMNMEKVMEVGIQEAINAQMQANPEMVKFKDIMLDFFSKHMSWKSVERGFVDDYMETFSQAEIEDMIAFYQTPTGKKTITTLPELMKRGSQHGMEKVQQNMPELLRMIEQRLKGN